MSISLVSTTANAAITVYYAPYSPPYINSILYGNTRAEACSLHGLTLRYDGFNCMNQNQQVVTSTSSTTQPCEEGAEWNAGTQECQEPDPCEGKPEDWEPMDFTVGGETTTYCAPKFDPPEECKAPSGTITYGGQTHVICEDRRNECQANGGTYGTYNGEETCLPEEFDDDLPTCDSQGNISMVWNPTSGTGGFVCESPIKPIEEIPERDDPNRTDTDQDGIPNEQDPDIDGDGIPNDQDNDIDGDGIININDTDIDGDQIHNYYDSDIDGDGIPNETDGDVDGDGIPNSSDSDSDGDGIPNADDPTPDGKQSPESDVGGGKGCEVVPFCQGDAVQCAIHYQLWKTRCEAEKGDNSGLTEEVSESYNPGTIDYSGQFGSAVDTAIAGITGLDAQGQGVESIATGLETTVATIIPDAQACTDPVISFFGKGSVILSCSKLQGLRDILGWLLYAMTAYYLFNLAMTPVESKV